MSRSRHARGDRRAEMRAARIVERRRADGGIDVRIQVERDFYDAALAQVSARPGHDPEAIYEARLARLFGRKP
jgi:hypothetical protein